MTENRAIELLEYIRKTGNGEAPYVGCAQEIAIDMAIKALEEIQQYRAIGTIEEFKDLKEKSAPKKPIYSNFDENEVGDIIPYKAVCPICGHEFEFGTWNDEENHHCVCDQKMDWE
jgi:hypothetical protein